MTYLETLTRQALRASIQPGGKLRIEPDWLITNALRKMVHEHREELVQEIMENAAPADPSREIAPDYHILMVATNLDSWEADDPRFGCEVMLDVCYRQLDAPYYAWLRHRTENARMAHEAGALDDAAFSTIRERFNAIHSWALQHIGDETLRHAIRTTNIKSYVQPSEETYNAYRRTWDDAWNEYQQRHAAPGNVVASSNPLAQLNKLLSMRGYAAIRSAVVGDVVVFVRDDSAVVPDKWSGKVRFMTDELSLMVGSTPEAVRQIYETKRVLGGTVVPSEGCPFGDETVPVRQTPAIQQSLFQAATA